MDGPKHTSEQVKSGLMEGEVGRPYSLSVSKFGAKFASNYIFCQTIIVSQLYIFKSHANIPKNNYENTTDENNLHGD